MSSYAQGAQKCGSLPSPNSAAAGPDDSGFGLFLQNINIPAGGLASADFTAYLPDGAQLVDVIFDTTTAHTSASAAVSVGTTLGGTEIAPSTDVKTAARTRPTFTNAQLAQMQSIPHTNGQSYTQVYFRLALGTPTSVGVTKAILVYAPKL